MRGRRGFSLVEVSLIMGLTFLLMGLVTAFFLRGKQYLAETETYSSTQRAANALLRKISDDVYHSTVHQIRVLSGNIAFLSFGATSDDAAPIVLDPLTGKIVWRKWVGYSFAPQEEKIYRGELELTSTTMDPEVQLPVPMAAAGFALGPGVTRHPLPGRVRDFSVARINDRIRLSVTTWDIAPVVTRTESEREVVITVQTEVALLN